MKKILAVLVMVLSLLAFTVSAHAAGTLADVGADYILGVVLHGDTPGNLLLKLFCNNVTPAHNSTVSTFTECTCTGYSAITLTRGSSWVITTANDPSDAIYTQQTVNFGGDCTTNGTVYGYYLTDSAGTILIGGELLASAFTPHNGYSLAITPKIVMSYGTPQ